MRSSIKRLLVAAMCFLAASILYGSVGQAAEVTPRTPLGDVPSDQGDTVWEAVLTVGDDRGFIGYLEHRTGGLSNKELLWKGASYTVTSVVLVESAEPESTNLSIYFSPGLPDDFGRLRLHIHDLGLNLVDGRVHSRHYIWFGVDLQWQPGETVLLSLRELPESWEPRSIDGRGNNTANPTWGMARTGLLAKGPNSYSDDVSTPPTSGPNPRAVSNLVFAQDRPVFNSLQVSDMFWQWGQFLDHDISHTPTNVQEPLPIAVPSGDPVFDPSGTGEGAINLDRSAFDPATGTGPGNPRRQINTVTAFIDGSQVYGSDWHRAHSLRANDGTGKLKTSHQGRLLPYNRGRLENEGGRDRVDLFLAGDLRVNEQVGLTSIQTLFVREHNRIADALAGQSPGLSGEQIYQRARKVVGAHIQAITFHEFLPLLLGPDAIDPYTGYDPGVNPTIANEFSTAAFRFGHSLLSPSLLIQNRGGDTETLSLADAFFNAFTVADRGISAFLRGLAAQRAQEVDAKVVDEVRNLLLRGPGGPQFDLAALNIQRGRDHGLADFNAVRDAYGLAPLASLAEVSSQPRVREALALAYGTIDRLDLWTGALAEDHVPGTAVGPTLHAIILDQFHRLRDGDRFWFENDPYFLANPELLQEVRTTTLADIIRRNTPIEDEISDNVFKVTPDPG